jgi:hypothetical protein
MGRAAQVTELMAAECGWDAAQRAELQAAGRDYLATYLPVAAPASAMEGTASGGTPAPSSAAAAG